MKAFIELVENFEGTINVLGNDGKTYEVTELIKIIDSKKEFYALGINYHIVDSFGKAKEGSQVAGIENDLKPMSDLKEILEWIADLLEEDGHTYQRCEKCGHIFLSDEGMYRIGEGEYLCESCHKEKFPTGRDWHIYALTDWWKDDDCEDEWTKEELQALSDEELDDLMSQAVDDESFPCFYTEA